MSDEHAVEFAQYSQPGQSLQPAELVGYYEPTQVADLTRQGRLLIVTDGVGGTASGVLASRYTIQKVLHDFYHSREPDLEKRLQGVIQQVNQVIFERNRRFPDRRPTATTLLAALIHQQKLLVARVGDGRAYVVWNQDIEHLTGETQPPAADRQPPANSTPPAANSKIEADKAPQPIAPVAVMADSPGQAAPPASTNSAAATATQPLEPLLAPTTGAPSNLPQPALAVSSPLCALGRVEQVKIELFSRRLFPGDTVVLCSGGLTGYVTEAEIAPLVSQNPPDLASRRLAELAAKHGSPDTLAVGVTRVLAKPLTQAAPTRQLLPPAPDWDNMNRPITKPLLPVVPLPRPEPKGTERRRWPFFIAMAAIVILFSLVGFLAGGYFLWRDNATPDSMAFQVGAVSATSESGTVVSPVVTPTQAGAPARPTLPPAVTLVAQGSSPVPSPTGKSSDVVAPTPTRRPLPPVPTIVLPSGCTNKARFAGDITAKDGTEFAPGEPFDKVWSVANYGTCPWGGGYTVQFASGDIMGAAKSAPISPVQAEGTGPITVSMTAPDLPGTYRGGWQMVGQDGQSFGPDLYVEIKVAAGALPVNETKLTTLYDFVANASQAKWSAGTTTYMVVNAPIDRHLVIPDPQGIVAVGPAELRGDAPSPAQVLMTHPHLELGYIEGVYPVTAPIQPKDLIIGSLGLPKAAAINDDGVTFELAFKPADDRPDQLLFSKLVKYEDSPVAIRQALDTLPAGQSGAFILRVKGGNSLSYDWATWIDLRLARP